MASKYVGSSAFRNQWISHSLERRGAVWSPGPAPIFNPFHLCLQLSISFFSESPCICFEPPFDVLLSTAAEDTRYFILFILFTFVYSRLYFSEHPCTCFEPPWVDCSLWCFALNGRDISGMLKQNSKMTSYNLYWLSNSFDNLQIPES